MVTLTVALLLVFGVALPAASSPTTRAVPPDYELSFTTPVDPALQEQIVAIDAKLREKFGMTAEQTAVGVLDLNTMRLATINPDRIEYAASVPKIGILLAYFQTHPEATTNIDPAVQAELAEMIKHSNNEMASKYSHLIGLKEIQSVLTDQYHLYDAAHGGGIWVGKHYGKDKERYGDPIADHSHAATVRQLLRYYLMLEQGKLVSLAASKKMREIFESPQLAHDNLKFVKGLTGRDVSIIRKWGSWEDWLHDTAVVTGGGRHYILVALTHHAKGDDYLEELAQSVDDVLK